MMLKALRLIPVPALLLATPALAQEGGLLSPEPGLIIWTIITFLVVLGVLWKFAYPHILGAVEAREARLRNLMGQAEHDRAEAAALLAEQQLQLEQTRTHAQDLIAESRVAAERLREQMLAETRGQQEDLLLRARQDIQRETDRALDTVRREAVELALAAAEKVIGRNLSTEDNYRLVQQALGQMPSVGSARVPAGV